MSNILEIQKKYLNGEIEELELKNSIRTSVRTNWPSVSEKLIENATEYVLDLIKNEYRESVLELSYSGFISSMTMRNWFANDGIPYLETM